MFVVQRLEQAEKSCMLALRYDPQYRDAEDELIKIRVEQLTVSCVCVCVYNVCVCVCVCVCVRA